MTEIKQGGPELMQGMSRAEVLIAFAAAIGVPLSMVQFASNGEPTLKKREEEKE